MAWLSACNGAHGPSYQAPETTNMSTFHGTITVGDAPAIEAEVFLLDRAGAVVATTRAQPSGSYDITPPAGYAGGWLLGKLYRPVIGARALEVDAGPRAVDLRVTSEEIHALRGRIVMPPGVPLEWLHVHVTPRELDGLSEAAARALLAVSEKPETRVTYATERIHEPAFALSVMPGKYWLDVERLFHDSAAMIDPPVSVTLAKVTAQGDVPIESAVSGAGVTIREDVEIVVEMAIVPPEEL
jgi:hypothetical protein